MSNYVHWRVEANQQREGAAVLEVDTDNICIYKQKLTQCTVKVLLLVIVRIGRRKEPSQRCQRQKIREQVHENVDTLLPRQPQ